MMLYCYILLTDTGFAPNPFWKYCTLLGCKPLIRRKINIDDWIIGLSNSRLGNKIIYCMEINEIISFDNYYNDKRFKKKIPIMDSRKCIYRRGDNIYHKVNEKYIQLSSRHSNKDRTENMRHKNRDLGGRNVLISKNFYYFGINMIPNPFEFLKVGRGHTCKFNENQIEKLLSYLENFEKGVFGQPGYLWKEGDKSWEIGK